MKTKRTQFGSHSHTLTHTYTRHDSFREKQTNAATDSRLFKGVDSNECTGRTRTRIVTTFIRNKHSGGRPNQIVPIKEDQLRMEPHEHRALRDTACASPGMKPHPPDRQNKRGKNQTKEADRSHSSSLDTCLHTDKNHIY
jgi:hypothetical protein